MSIKRTKISVSEASIYALPPTGVLLANEYLNLWEEMEKSSILRGSLPCTAIEGGFSWKVKGLVEIRSLGACPPCFESTWEDTKKEWTEKGIINTDVELDFSTRRDGIAWHPKGGLPLSYKREFKKILLARGWHVGKVAVNRFKKSENMKRMGLTKNGALSELVVTVCSIKDL